MTDRVIVYIDSQNVYRSAREYFVPVPGDPPYVHGQVRPVSLAELICTRTPVGATRALGEVRVYTGRPDATRQPRAYAAHMRQCAAWERAGAIVIARSLKYPRTWPAERAREKGIDVALAVDFVADAVVDRYDVGIIFSTDTDLRPALEFVTSRFDGIPRAESAAWRVPGANRALFANNPRRTWCHFLTAADYDAVRDPTDYNV